MPRRAVTVRAVHRGKCDPFRNGRAGELPWATANIWSESFCQQQVKMLDGQPGGFITDDRA